MMFRSIHGTLGAVAACAIGLTGGAAHADTPVLSGGYSWEDGKGTTLGTFGSVIDPTNTGPIDGVTPHTGTQMLKLTKEDGTASAPQVYVAFIENLQDGDVVTAGAFFYDDVPGTSYRGRVWAHYAQSGDPLSFAGSASGPTTYTSGIGWEESSHTWVFDSDGGTRDALMIEVRLYTSQDNAPFYIDDVSVDVYCAANEDLTITFANFVAIGDPAAPGPECKPAKPCEPTPLGSYGWEDETNTVFNATGNFSIVENSGPINGVTPPSGDRMLWMQQDNPSGTPQAWVAYIENLSDGDEIFASMLAYDDTPGGNPSVRIWAHGAVSGDPGSVVGQYGGENQDYPSGIGWEELNEHWVFDSLGGQRDALMIQVRLYASGENNDFYVDDISIEVCSDNPNTTVTFPDSLKPPTDPCEPPSGTVTLSGNFGWEDGKSTILGYDSNDLENVLAANITSPEPVNTGKHALRVTEVPHGGTTPMVFLAYIEYLENGDVIHGRFNAYDDTPGGSPEVRIWGRRVFSGDVNSFSQSLGGNDNATAGDGWEELCHTWVFDGGPDNRDAMVIEARVYATPSTCEECSTDFYIDDLEVLLFANPNATITFADGIVIGEPPMICPADITGNGEVDAFDLFAVLGAWGTSDPDADIDNDGTVDGEDLGVLLASWGACPKPYLAPVQGDVDLVVNTTAVGGGMSTHDIFVQLGDADEALVNVYDANVNFSGGFDASSFIAIGQEDASVVPDPSFDTFEFAFGIGLGANAGWYNENPTNDIGRAGLYPNNQVLIASFTMADAENAAGTLSVTYEDADGRPVYATASFDTADVSTPCEGDLTDDGAVDVSDLLALLSAWGPCPGCTGDLTGDNVVDVSDLLMLLSNWGSCD